MRVLVDSRKFYASIANAEDRAKVDRYFSGARSFDSMPILRVTLPEAKTLTQLGTVWLDFTTVAGLLHCEPSYVYYTCLKAEQLNDIWLKQRECKWHFSTLSGLTKEETSAAIPRLRDYMQTLVNDAYGEWVPIVWAARENMETENGKSGQEPSALHTAAKS